MILLAWLVAAMVPLPLRAEGPHPWNRFRGPNGSGVLEVSHLPVEFGPDKGVIWKRPLPAGHSSPILSRDRLYLTAAEEDELWTLCLDRGDGHLIWRMRAPRARREKLDHRNNPASPSPALDEDGNVYVFFGDFGLLSYDPSGKERWRFPLGPFDNLYGMGVSPVLIGKSLFLVCDQQTGSFLLSLDKDTGHQNWRVDRPEATSGHSTPIVFHEAGVGDELLVAGSFLLTAYAPESGSRLWWVRGLSFEMKSTPVIDGEMLFVNGYATPFNQPEKIVETEEWARALESGDRNANGTLSQEELQDSTIRSMFPFLDLNRDGELDFPEWNYYRAAMATKNAMLGIRLGGEGDMTRSNLRWEYHRSVPQLPSPLLYRDVLYMVDDGGIATSFHPASGEVIARSRISGAVGKYYSSPVAGDGKIYLVSETCQVAILQPGGGLEPIVVNDMDSSCYATPALDEGRIYLRTIDTLYALGSEAETHSPPSR